VLVAGKKYSIPGVVNLYGDTGPAFCRFHRGLGQSTSLVEHTSTRTSTKLRPCTFVCALGYAGIPDNTFLRIPVIRCLWPAASKLNSEGGMPSLRITPICREVC